MAYYIDFPTSNITSIDVNFEDYNRGDSITEHMHHYHEFTLVTKGTCIHRFRGVDVPIIAGDVFLIPPHENHSYFMNSSTSIVNCYFFPERLGQFADYINDTTFAREVIPSNLDDVKEQWNNLIAPERVNSQGFPKEERPTDNLTKQGVLHLPAEEALDVEYLLRRIESEHSNLQFDAERMKAAILQMILVIFKRARNSQPQKPPSLPEQKKQLILRSLIYIEQNYTEPMTAKEIADASSLSESYFRNVFKEVTGLSPLDYLNRLRVAKALEYLQSENMSVTEAASLVGIPDPNYFTRIFKKIMGHTPRYYKSNPTSMHTKEDKQPW